MNTQDKINKIQDATIEQFKLSLDLNTVCAAITPLAIASGIHFSEIIPLVKTIGKANGYIVDIADRKKYLVTDLSGKAPTVSTYKELQEWLKELSLEYNVPEKVALIAVKDNFRYYGKTIPKKPLLTGWKLCALECWQEYPEYMDIYEVRKYLREHDFNHSLYTQAYHELFTELVKVGGKAGFKQFG